MEKIVGIGFTVVLLACSSSGSKVSSDAGKSDLPANPAAGDVGPELRAGDVASGADQRAGDVANGPDLRASDTASGPDTLGRDVTADQAAAADSGGDTPARLDLLAPDRGNDTSGASDANFADGAGRDAFATSDMGETCSCGDTQTSSPVAVSWGCFCAVESCTRTLADFVDDGDTNRYFKSNLTVLLLEYAGCNRILVRDFTYSRNVPASEYVFDRTTKALVGAKVWLDDRQHTCPFPTSGARWVFGYQSGSYPIPSTCQATTCVPGSGTCPP